MCHMPRPSRAPLFDNENDTSRRKEITETIITQFSLVTCYLLPLSPTYLPLPPILKHLSICFFPLM